MTDVKDRTTYLHVFIDGFADDEQNVIVREGYRGGHHFNERFDFRIDRWVDATDLYVRAFFRGEYDFDTVSENDALGIVERGRAIAKEVARGR